MAAGLGFKTFTTGEVLTSADTNGYLMQGVLVFASAAARDAAITSPQEGQFAYLKDTNVTTYYTGSAWANLDTTGMTNPMTTTGDMVYSSSGSTPARLGIGTTGQVVTVAGGIPSWATPSAASSGLVLISRQTFSGVATTTTTFDGVFSSTYNNYVISVENVSATTGSNDFQFQLRYAGPTTQATNYVWTDTDTTIGAAIQSLTAGAHPQVEWQLSPNINTATDPTNGMYELGLRTGACVMNGRCVSNSSGNGTYFYGYQTTARTYTGFLLKSSSTNISGTVAVYGLALT